VSEQTDLEVGQRWMTPVGTLTLRHIDEEIIITTMGEGGLKPEFPTPLLRRYLAENGCLLCPIQPPVTSEGGADG
jgi:hypothetical protein